MSRNRSPNPSYRGAAVYAMSTDRHFYDAVQNYRDNPDEAEWKHQWLLDRRRECHALTLDSPGSYGPTWGYHCQHCARVLDPNEDVLASRSGDQYCDECFDRAHKDVAEQAYAEWWQEQAERGRGSQTRISHHNHPYQSVPEPID